MNLNALPGCGWILGLIFKVSMSVPFWVVWTKLGIGAKYFAFLPALYLAPPFWDCVGVFICLGILVGFSPFRVSSSSSSSGDRGVKPAS